MSNVLDALNATDRAIRQLIEAFGASRRDLMDVGMADYTARKWLGKVMVCPLASTKSVRVPSLGLPDTVALVPMGELGRRYLRHDVYIRDARLRGQIRLRATHLGWSDGGRIENVRPITQRWRIGSAAAIDSTTVASWPAITAEPDLIDHWPGPATLVELGAPMTIGLPLGFAPNSTGGAPAIPGVRHVLLADLLAAACASGTLTDVATA
ncbi:hypothetical protein [Amycolatopsis thailandensis]|uniref:hypothetical protein n=1 Tax=Amycolatopsis thailandensis TaxID=589330 RepID=UPI003627F177